MIRSLTLLDSTARAEDPRRVARFRRLTWFARTFGPRWTLKPAMRILFGRSFRKCEERRALRRKWEAKLLDVRPSTWAAVEGVFSRPGMEDVLPHVRAPTLVACGEHDAATLPELSLQLHEGLSDSRLTHIPDAGHSAPIEQGAIVADLIDAFVTEQER